MINTQTKTLLLLFLFIIIMLKFLIAPLVHAVDDKKALLGMAIESYRSRSMMLRAYKATRSINATDEMNKNLLLKSVYEKRIPFITIQVDVLQNLLDAAEKEKLTVLNFEFPDATPDKEISEVPVLVRLKGPHKAVIALLQAIEANRMALKCKQFEGQNSNQDFLISMLVTAFRMER
jgi:hypothetical protein